MVIYTWIKELVWAVISWNLSACWRILIWTIGIITLPLRALSALQREKMTAKHFGELQFEIENLLWNHRKLEGQYALSVKERNMLESLLAELEEEHDKAILKIEHLKKQVYNLKTENLELKGIKGKPEWGLDTKDETKEAQITELTPTAPPLKSSITKRTRKGSIQKETEKVARPNQTVLGSTDLDEVILEKRDMALSQSVLSGLLSLLVGTIAYDAKDPGIPLVLALFVVVGMSLKSVAYLLSTVRNKAAREAIALLSFNWFILGTLTYPTLPIAAHFLFPSVMNCMGWTLGLISPSF